MKYTYDPALVTISILVAVLASYVALDLASRVVNARRLVRTLWWLGGSAVMGMGIWSMHFVAMLAFTLPVPIAYDLPLVLLSIVAAITGSGVALFALREPRLGWLRLVGVGTAMGSAVLGMHYTGMAAMRLAADVHYAPATVGASVAIAVGASVAALWLAVRLRDDRTRHRHWRRMLAALVMGGAIAGMHYTGMAAAHFTPAPGTTAVPSRYLLATSGVETAIVTAAVFILAIALAGLAVERAMRMDATVAAAAARLAAIVESSSDAIDSKSLDGIVQSWNAAAERLYGYRTEEIVGQPVTMLIPADGHGEIVRLLARVGQGERIENLETVRLRQDGTRVDVSLTLSPITDSAGQITGVSTIARDISGRREVEAELRQHARDSALAAEVAEAVAADTSVDVMLQCTAEALVRHLDAAFARVWLLDDAGETLVLRASAGLYTHLDGAHGRVPVGAFKIGKIAQERRPHLTNDVQSDARVGDKAWASEQGMVAFAGYPLLFGDRLHGVAAIFARHPLGAAALDAVGGVAARLAVALEHRRAQAELAASQAELQALVGAMTDAILVLDADGRYVRIAETAAPRLYRPPVELVGRLMHEVLPVAVADLFLDHIRRALGVWEPVGIEYSMPIGDEIVWFAGTVSPMSEREVVWVARDITP